MFESAQIPAVEAAGAQPDHVLFAVDDLERQIRPNPAHDHVDRVGADVDGRDAHVLHRCYGWRPKLMAHATTTSGSALADALTSQTLTLSAELGRARRGEPRGVHLARTSSRRLRELLPVAASAAPGAGIDRARRDVRRVTRLLGKVRELDVAIAELSQGAEQHPWDAVVVDRIGRQLDDERRRLADDVRRRLEAIDADRLRTRLEDIAQAVADHRTRSVAERAVARRLKRRAASLVAAIEAAGTLYATEALHAVRIAAKKLRYTLEVVRDAIGLPVEPMVAPLRRQQDTLGRMHDLEVLALRVRGMSIGLGERSAARQEDIALSLDRECRELHATFLAKRAALGDLATRGTNEVLAALLGRRPRMAKATVGASKARDAMRSARRTGDR